MPLSRERFAEFIGTLLLLAGAVGSAHMGMQVVAYFMFAAYWLTVSTSFASPAVTLARGLA